MLLSKGCLSHKLLLSSKPRDASPEGQEPPSQKPRTGMIPSALDLQLGFIKQERVPLIPSKPRAMDLQPLLQLLSL